MIRVLVVEDEQDLRGALERMLANAGYAVDVAPDAATAVTKADETAFDVFLIDMLLPDGSGLALTQTLCANTDRPKAVLMSGGDPDTPVELAQAIAQTAGAIEFLIKPFSKARALKAVEKVTRSDTAA